MSMIDILKDILPDGAAISKEKETGAKYVFTMEYKGMKAEKCELRKTCAPGYEEQVCRNTLNTTIAGMYAEAGQAAEAKKWLDGTGEQAEERKWATPRGKAATTAKNKYRDSNYDRMELAVPKGMKKRIEEITRQHGFSSKNAYIVEAIKEKYQRDTGEELTWEK